MAKQRVIQYVNFYTDGSAARKIELVEAMGQSGHQCLIFTCHKREEELYRAAFGEVALLSL